MPPDVELALSRNAEVARLVRHPTLGGKRKFSRSQADNNEGAQMNSTAGESFTLGRNRRQLISKRGGSCLQEGKEVNENSSAERSPVLKRAPSLSKSRVKVRREAVDLH